MSRHHLQVLVAGAAAFLLNPTFACMSDPEFQYGEAEMRAAVEGTWDAELTFQDGSQKSVTFTLKQATSATASATNPSTPRARSFVRPAAACGSRVFVRSAGACISSSSMPLTGTFVSGDESYRAAMIRGHLSIPSLTFDEHALLTIELGDHTLSTQNLTNEGTVTNVTIHPRPSGASLGTATLVRRPGAGT